MSSLFDPDASFDRDLFRPQGQKGKTGGFKNLFSVQASQPGSALQPTGNLGTQAAPPSGQRSGTSTFTESGDYPVPRDYAGSAFTTGEAHAVTFSIGSRAQMTSQSGPTDQGMWRLDISNFNWRWKWWAGNTAGLPVTYDSNWAGAENLTPGAEAPTDEATESADSAEKAFRALMKGYLDQLNELAGQVPDAPDLSGVPGAAQAVIDKLQDPLTGAENTEIQNQAAISAGYFTLDSSGEVVADLAAYQQAQQRANDPSRVPQAGSVPRSQLQQRQLRMQTQRDIQLVRNITSDVGGDSFGKAMSSVNEATAAIGNADAQRRLAVDDQNFAQAMMSFQAEDAQLQSAINRGAVTATQAIDRRERGIMAELDVVYKNANVVVQQFGMEITSLVTRMQAIETAANAAMNIEVTAQSVWQFEYDKIMQDFWDDFNAREANDLAGQPEPFDWGTLVAVVTVVLKGIELFSDLLEKKAEE
jgi:hypothetical protein